MTDTLLTRLRGLPREMAPASDLWPTIQARLEPPRQRWNLPRAATAAAVFFLAAMVLRLGSQAPAPQLVGSNLAVLSASVELEYSGALRDLRDSIIGAVGVDAATGIIADYEAGLELVHQSTNQVRAALAQDPQSALLNEMLANLQKKQLGVMREIALIAETNRGTAT